MSTQKAGAYNDGKAPTHSTARSLCNAKRDICLAAVATHLRTMNSLVSTRRAQTDSLLELARAFREYEDAARKAGLGVSRE